MNDAPVATITPVSYSATEQTSLSLKNNGLSISDVDAGSGSLTVTLSVVEGTLTVTAGTSGASVSNSGTSSVTVTGTAAQINALLNTNATSTVSYSDNSDTPAASTTLTLSVNDNGNTGGGALIGSDTATITIGAVNDAPVATITPVSYSATEQTSLSLKNNGLSISDVDAGSGSLTVTLSVVEGTLTVTAGTSGASVSNSGTSSVTVTGTAAQINALLNTNATSTVSYSDNSDTPAASTTLTLSVNDNGNTGGGALIGSDTATITIGAVNDAPVNTVPGGTLAVNAGAALGFTAANTVSVHDVDGNLASTQLSVLHGALTVSLAGGASISAGASGSSTLTLSGTETQIDAALATLSYQSVLNFSGSDTLTVLSTDSGALTDSDTVAINVTAVNHAPVVQVSETLTRVSVPDSILLGTVPGHRSTGQGRNRAGHERRGPLCGVFQFRVCANSERQSRPSSG